MPKKSYRDRNPQEFAAVWEESGTAHLNDVYREILLGRHVECQIDTEQTYTAASSSVTITSRPRATRPAMGKGYYIDWNVVGLAGAGSLIRPLVIGGIVNLEGKPTSTTRYYGNTSIGPIRQYRDKLFRGGDLTAIVPNTERGPGGQPFDLGRVVGITLVVENAETYPVWGTPPSDKKV